MLLLLLERMDGATGVLIRWVGFGGFGGDESVEIRNEEDFDGVYLCLYEPFDRNFDVEMGMTGVCNVLVTGDDLMIGGIDVVI